ncbi:hypothetical protein [Pseudoxanthomonas sp. SE1]|uniref:prealbumin-like fold domain-containing protein n=1 Tax=Pseudoxanthomonas sp. SE1 TaxID=1664560 RepID=UPI00240D4372|nr:hypothetical protein [Pseudoxanthomonas sp. SE1]WFC43309.1 hypothetical protein OY559_07340 [Pseudoxanthomonas sp. SE1]
MIKKHVGHFFALVPCAVPMRAPEAGVDSGPAEGVVRAGAMTPFRTIVVRLLAVAALYCALVGQSLAVEILNFGTETGGTDLLTTPMISTVGGITVTTAAQQSGGTWDAPPAVFRSNGGINGTSGVIYMSMDASTGTSSSWTQVTFTFSRPVTNLAFTVVDLDGGPSGSWNDIVTVSSTPLLTPTTPLVGSQVSWNAATRTAQAISNASIFDATGNIRFQYATPVTSVTVRYVAGPTSSGARLGQTVTIDDLSWDSGAVRVQKLTNGGVGGPFAFTQTNLLTAPAGITTTVADTPTPASPGAHEISGPGANVTVTESLPSGWVLTSTTCTDANSAVTGNTGTVGTLSGSTLSLNAASLVLSGADITCTFTNTLQQTDIQVVKTASPDPVVSGDVVSYQIVVSNNGPLAASSVLLTDVAGVGQDCTTPSTTATCSTAGGASCPSPTVPVSSLLGAGITIPVLPVGGQVTVTVQCSISASGL